MIDNSISIYIHIPFCKKKCNYCDFYSITSCELVGSFLGALEKEFEKRRDYLTLPVKTIYIGGGTPSVLSPFLIERLFRIISGFIKYNEVSEITFEANPESIDRDKLSVLKALNVNRISIGLQSTNDKKLQALGRVHSFDDFLCFYEIIRSNFVVNLDLIYGLGGESFESFEEELKIVVGLKPHHISLYALEIHKNTPFFGRIKIDEDEQSKIYLRSVEFLENNGYNQYEISNFAWQNHISLHNMNYWLRGNYIGFGPSASSCYQRLRWKNTSDLLSYINSLNNGKIELEYMEELSETDVMNERIMLILRTREGVKLNSDVFNHFKDQIENAFKKGYLELVDGAFRIKKEYLFVSNYIISEIIH